MDCTLRGSGEDKEALDSAKMLEEMLDSSMAFTGILLRLGIIGRAMSQQRHIKYVSSLDEDFFQVCDGILSDTFSF